MMDWPVNTVPGVIVKKVLLGNFFYNMQYASSMYTSGRVAVLLAVTINSCYIG
jgi:hypothetical protein